MRNHPQPLPVSLGLLFPIAIPWLPPSIPLHLATPSFRKAPMTGSVLPQV